MKAVICAIAKYEYDYIKEWVEYHLNLGFDKIVIYDNNDINGERYEELLSDFIAADQVEIRDVRGKLGMQRIVYNEFYKENDFDWVAFIDIDEFISPNRTKYKNIKKFIEKNSFADAIYLYWRTYGDAGKIYPIKTNPRKNKEQISILNQYSVPADNHSLIDNALKRQNAWGKSIIKNGLPVNFLHEHFIVDPHTFNYVDCYGNKTEPYMFYPDINYVENTYKECYIKHIYTKSLQEYIEYKVKRPAANVANGIMHFPSKYFKVNEITEEKRKYMESIGYKMEFTFKPDAYVIIEVKNLEEYYKLKPYIFNVINLCSCRFNLCVTEEKSAVEEIYRELNEYFNECAIYFDEKQNAITGFNQIFLNDRSNIVEHTNCIVHMNIPYNVNIDEYILDFIEPVFGKSVIRSNFVRLFDTENSIFVSEGSISEIDKNSEDFIKFKNTLEKINIHKDIKYVALTGNFIVKTKDVIKYKKEYNNITSEFYDPNFLIYFISSIFDNFIYNMIVEK